MIQIDNKQKQSLGDVLSLFGILMDKIRVEEEKKIDLDLGSRSWII